MPNVIHSESAIQLPFSFDAQGNVRKTRDYQKIWADRVSAAIGTNQGERVFRSQYGTSVSRYALDTVDSMKATVEEEIFRVFASEFPTLTVTGVLVEFIEGTNELNIDVSYTLPDLSNATTKVGIAYTDKTALIQEVNL